MSMESLLDEAIVKAKEAEDWQLVEWLRMARGGESAARWYTAKLSEARLDISNLMTENAKLREQVERLQPKDCEGNVLDIADTVSMLRSEYDGEHEWDDVVVELALTKWGGDRWIVRGSKGEAWACDCAKTGYDEDAYESSDDVEPIANPTLIEAENAKLREQGALLFDKTLELGTENAKLRELVSGLEYCVRASVCDYCCPLYDPSGTDHRRCESLERELGIEVD